MNPAFLKIEFILTKEKIASKDKQGLNCSVEFYVITMRINDMCRFVFRIDIISFYTHQIYSNPLYIKLFEHIFPL